MNSWHPIKKSLVIVAAGDESIHLDFCPSSRNFDLITIFYGKSDKNGRRFRESSDIFYCGSGLKIELAREFLLHWGLLKRCIDFSAYEFVWFPDDDLRFVSQGFQVNALFDVARTLGADAFQPAIANDNISWKWESTQLIPGAFAHKVNLVEMMAHGFTGTFFQDAYLPAIHVMDFMKSGWGLDPIWLKIGESRLRREVRSFVIDCVPILHLRKPGSGLSEVHKRGIYEAQFIPQIETNRMKTLEVYASNQTEAPADRDLCFITTGEIDRIHNGLNLD